jgi:hypothetical protein
LTIARNTFRGNVGYRVGNRSERALLSDRSFFRTNQADVRGNPREKDPNFAAWPGGLKLNLSGIEEVLVAKVHRTTGLGFLGKT